MFFRALSSSPSLPFSSLHIFPMLFRACPSPLIPQGNAHAVAFGRHVNSLSFRSHQAELDLPLLLLNALDSTVRLLKFNPSSLDEGLFLEPFITAPLFNVSATVRSSFLPDKTAFLTGGEDGARLVSFTPSGSFVQRPICSGANSKVGLRPSNTDNSHNLRLSLSLSLPSHSYEVLAISAIGHTRAIITGDVAGQLLLHEQELEEEEVK